MTIVSDSNASKQISPTESREYWIVCIDPAALHWIEVSGDIKCTGAVVPPVNLLNQETTRWVAWASIPKQKTPAQGEAGGHKKFSVSWGSVLDELIA